MNQNIKIRELQMQGHGYKKIAKILGISENTVKSYCRRHPVENSCLQCGRALSHTQGKKRKKRNFKAYVASRFVPRIMKSLSGIPVYRGTDTRSMQTMRNSLSYLEKGESVIVYPDIDYTAGYETESEIYEGFLLLGQLYKRNTGKSLRFVPLYIDDAEKRVKEYEHITIDDFRKERSTVYDYIKKSINGKEA